MQQNDWRDVMKKIAVTYKGDGRFIDAKNKEYLSINSMLDGRPLVLDKECKEYVVWSKSGTYVTPKGEFKENEA